MSSDRDAIIFHFAANVVDPLFSTYRPMSSEFWHNWTLSWPELPNTRRGKRASGSTATQGNLLCQRHITSEIQPTATRCAPLGEKGESSFSLGKKPGILRSLLSACSFFVASSPPRCQVQRSFVNFSTDVVCGTTESEADMTAKNEQNKNQGENTKRMGVNIIHQFKTFQNSSSQIKKSFPPENVIRDFP